jgi:hypothetical protein
MEFQEVKKEKQKIEEDFKTKLVEFEKKYRMIVENIEIKRIYEIGKDSKLLSVTLSLKIK